MSTNPMDQHLTVSALPTLLLASLTPLVLTVLRLTLSALVPFAVLMLLSPLLEMTPALELIQALELTLALDLAHLRLM
jgi:hypothetical protein